MLRANNILGESLGAGLRQVGPNDSQGVEPIMDFKARGGAKGSGRIPGADNWGLSNYYSKVPSMCVYLHLRERQNRADSVRIGGGVTTGGGI